METIFTPQIVAFIAGPGGAMVVLVLVLYMAYKLVGRLISLMSSHLERIEQKFDSLNDTVKLLAAAMLESRNPNRGSANLISLERETVNGQQK